MESAFSTCNYFALPMSAFIRVAIKPPAKISVAQPDSDPRPGRMQMDQPTDLAKLKAQTAYNAASDHFDDEPLGFWAHTGTRTVERLALPQGATVLDVGCGTGASAIPAATVVGPTGRVVGIDLADRLLNRARDKAQRQSLSNVEFRQGDM